MSKSLVEGKYFRVYPITKVAGIRKNNDLVVETQELKDGLAIEKRIDDSHYIVVAFVRPDISLEDVDFRTVDMIEQDMLMEDFWEMMQEYKNCVEFAKQTLIDLQEISYEG